jgi:hypothetical protein
MGRVMNKAILAAVVLSLVAPAQARAFFTSAEAQIADLQEKSDAQEAAYDDGGDDE